MYDVGKELTISDNVCDVLHNLNGLRVWVGARVLVIETIDVCHEKQMVGVDHGSRNGRQGVVITELDFGDGQRVVLVDNGDDAHVQQRVECVLGIEIPCPLCTG